MILVGELALWIALLMAAWGAIVAFAGASTKRPELIASAERAAFATFACLVLATAGLLVALVTSDFSLAYVASFTTANLPGGYKLAALWAGDAGALLLWTLLLSTCAALAIALNTVRNGPFMPYVIGTLSMGLLFFLVLLCFRAGPYARIAPIPAEGRGMIPELQNPAAALHAPSLYVGYVAATIPLAFAVAALRVRGVDDDWTYEIRRWATISWFFLTVGITIGMWTAYVDPARHASWPWEPMRSWTLVPWLGVAVIGYLLTARHRGLRLTSHGTRNRVGAYIAGAGVIAVAAAFAGIPLTEERDVSLGSGEAATLVDPFRRSWTFTSQGVSDFPELNRAVEAVALRSTRNGVSYPLITSERRQYIDSRGAPTFDTFVEPGLSHSLLQDTYVVLTNVVGDRADVRIGFHPLRMWVWIGGIAMAVGGSMVMWPAAGTRRGEA